MEETKVIRCKSCNNWAAQKGDPDDLCHYCRSVRESEKVADLKEVTFHDVRIRPTFKSPRNGSLCKSIQGWRAIGPLFDSDERWFSSKGQAMAEVQKAYTDWTTTGSYVKASASSGLRWEQQRRSRFRKTWGANPASMAADQRMAEDLEQLEEAEFDKKEEENARGRLFKVAPEMLKLLREIEQWAAEREGNTAMNSFTFETDLFDRARELITLADGKA
jgi:hypothetical protein